MKDRPRRGRSSFHRLLPIRATVSSCAKPISASQARTASKPSASKTTAPSTPSPASRRKRNDQTRAKQPSSSHPVNDAHTFCPVSDAKRRTLLHHRRYRVYRFRERDSVPAVNRSVTRSQLRHLFCRVWSTVRPFSQKTGGGPERCSLKPVLSSPASTAFRRWSGSTERPRRFRTEHMSA